MSHRPLRFCLVTTFYPPYSFGGDGILVERLAVELVAQGHHVEVVHCGDAYNSLRASTTPARDGYQDHPAIVHHRLESGVGFLSPLLTQQTGRPVFKTRALQRILDTSAFDVVHFHNMSLIGLTALRFSRAITLYTMHEHWLVCPTHVLWRFNREPCERQRCTACQLHARRPPQVWRHTGLLKRELQRVHAFIAPSEFTRTKHLEMGLRVSSPIVHIPNFMPLPQAVPVPDPAPHVSPYFLYVGRLERIKGVHVAVDAFKRFTKAALLVVGDGSEMAALKAQAGGQSHIHFVGRLPFADVERHMRHALAVIVPSVGFETFGNIIAEANAWGTPVIAHRLGPFAEMIDGRGGMTYGSEQELQDVLNRLYQDSAYRSILGERARDAYLARWTPQRHLSQYHELITTLQPENRTFASHS